MKKLIFMAAIAMVLTVFNACTKDELKTAPAAEPAKTSKAGVYLENDYLVVKNMDAVDSLMKLLQNKSLAEQASWENQLGLKSAKMYRAQASDKLAAAQNEADEEKYAKELVKEGYFSMADSSLHYPFYNYSWDGVLNKNGVIKIGGVLYSFQKDAQISVLDGSKNTLDQYLINGKVYDQSKIQVYSFPRLKSTTPTGYGDYGFNRDYSYGGGTRFTMTLRYDKITDSRTAPNGQPITVQTGLKYYLYFHEELKGLFAWRDTGDIFWQQHLSYNLGGNWDPYMGTIPNHTNTTPDPGYTQLNTTTFANVYLTVSEWYFNYALSPIPSTYPGTGPIINNLSWNGYTNAIPAILNLTKN